MGKAVKQTRAGATTAPRQSLAATHPSNYVKAASTKMPPPPTPMLTGQTSASALAKAKSPSTTTSPLNYPYPTPSPSPPEKLHHDFNTPAAGNHTFKDPRTCPPSGGRPPGNQDQCTQISGVGQHGVARPWERHNDPTFTVSDSPPCWTRNHTVLNTNMDNVNILSPTFMHGLPFGSMTEAAHHYPSSEGLSRLK